jgi:hypothetical protein
MPRRSSPRALEHAAWRCWTDQEDTVLRSYTARLLTPEEWSAVASSISDAVRRGPAPRER